MCSNNLALRLSWADAKHLTKLKLVFSFYTGWARISGAQFKNMGQLGFNSPNDPRFALTYLNTGPADPVDKPSYITQTSFHMGLSPQIGIFGGSNIRITDNVMYQTVGGGE